MAQECSDGLAQPHDRITVARKTFARDFTMMLQRSDQISEQDGEYTYTFQTVPQQTDPVIELIRSTIRRLNQHPEHGLRMCNNDIQVFATTSAPPIWPTTSHGSENEVKFYTFLQECKVPPATVPVSIDLREDWLSSEQLRVRTQGQWMPLEQWLLSLADDEVLRRRSLESQTSFYYQRNGKHFRLMDLPVELRLTIFEYTIAPAGEIYPLYTKAGPFVEPRIIMGIGYDPKSPSLFYGYRQHLYFSPESRDEIPQPETTILRVSKQRRDEGLRASWEGLRRCFVNSCNFDFIAMTVVRGLNVALPFNLLGRIELSFTTREWFAYFGVKFEPHLHREESAIFSDNLGSLSSLTELNIRFRDPSDGWLGYPWGRAAKKTSCQTVMVDWIMVLAFAEIKHFRIVKLTGYVKKPQKAKWESLLRSKCAGQVHEFDHVAAVQDILATHPSEL
jgi:hypothetical protein